MEKFKVTFYPKNKSIEVPKDTTILSAAISAGISINSACGGDGVCGKCKVLIKSGKVAAQANSVLTLEEKHRQIFLACQTVIHGDVEVEVLPESITDMAGLRIKGLYTKSENVEPIRESAEKSIFKHSPLATKIYLELPKPNFEDTAGDLERIYRELRNIQGLAIARTALTNIRQLGELLRDSDWKVTVTLGRRNDTVEIVLIEPGDTTSNNFGLAFDIGTTTISGQLIDLNSKKVLGTKASYNKQASFGSDVITRIIYAHEPDGLEKLHNAVVETINLIIRELAKEHNVNLNDINCILCAGNTTMIHLLLSVDPTYIRKEPYVPTINSVPTIRAKEAGININPRALLSCVPGVSSYVGGDTTAGILSSGLYKEEGLSLLIDIGTNGEIALGNKEFMVACAASAGPAFEGSGITNGMRASKGAIEKVKIDPKTQKVSFETIGEDKPRGICGSGYIDIIGELLAAGIIDKSGKIIAEGSRIRESELGKEFIIALKEESATERDIVINEADIDNIKRAKAAIYSAVSILVEHLNFDFSEIKKVFIAGGFGTSIDIEKAVRIGLLPDLNRDVFKFIGNSSLKGAQEMLLYSDTEKIAQDIADKITYIELSADPGYMDHYMAALFFPHTDLLRFPSLRGK
ncbi:MAG: ASKHA domain-containing protein [Candidatus Omnitrophota bacterium]|jgi:uncharacterized 2Fe-2S/4Fe-4S cluster protein (DUF4445 family)